ncbi:MAG TPA: S41 family peptidase [Anaerolineales bacterium]|nr:S41 family peptidase [Anaerolineales bacterium]
MNKTLRTILVAFVALVLIACSFGGGIAADRLLPIMQNPTLAVNPATSGGTQAQSSGGTPTDLQSLFVPFWEAWNIIHQQYVDQPVNDTKLMEGAINGMMQSLGDPHSTYMDPQTYKDATSQLAGSYAGIGAYVDTNGKLLTITKPIPGSPAEKAGLLAGDQIVAVDGTDVTSLDPESVRQKVLGPEGTTVKLTILRPGQTDPFDVTITRATIVVPSVNSKMLDGGIAYVQITTFGDNTASDLHKQLGDLMAQNPKGLILDLRDNGGGYLDTAISVASEFIPSGVIVTEKAGDGTEKSYSATSGGLATKIPMVVLVNAYSASASEIVSGAIQDYGRGKLIGETTYGKGSVQNWVPLSQNEGAVRVTIARWLTPKGRTIDKKGLTPDIAVTLTQDDIKAGKDPQLDAAIKALTTPQ